MIKLTATQQITPYKWVHPDEERELGRYQACMPGVQTFRSGAA
jgi:hypothetical protein